MSQVSALPTAMSQSSLLNPRALQRTLTDACKSGDELPNFDPTQVGRPDENGEEGGAEDDGQARQDQVRLELSSTH